MLDYVEIVRNQSAAFATAIGSVPLDAPVPSCPAWTVADLIWHLTEVQAFWATIVSDLVIDPSSVDEPDRPADGTLLAIFEEQSARLVDALADGDPEAVCWSWDDNGHSVRWVRRRQAHEALIHRVDAELAAGTDSTIDSKLGADGVDEILNVQLDIGEVPDWATYEPDGTSATIELIDRAASWSMDLGRFTGTSPTGRAHDLAALRLVEHVSDPTTTLRGSGPDLDLWLWGRGPIDWITVEGDPSVADRLRATAADST